MIIVDLIWAVASWAVTLVVMLWAAASALLWGRATRLGFAIVALTGLLAAWPPIAAKWFPGPLDPLTVPLLVGISPIIAATAFCMGRLKSIAGTRLVGRVGLGAMTSLWLAVAKGALLPF